ncbi:MAG: BatA domain-containing protein, partial [Alphaproteobacteria bacterium]|nr:BatA domain-containing protein [Alphaproteobacteria bacterium]
MTSIGPLAFGAPWVLFGLIALPVIWWLLRVTPPAAKRVRFPAVRLLLGIPQSEETPAHTPLWLLLLRLAVAGLVILALADPYLNPQSAGLKSSPVVVVVDNGWAAAARWDDRVGAMQTMAAEAERDGRPLVVLPTAMSDAVVELKLLSGAEAQGAVKSVAPQPFGVDRAKALTALKRLNLKDNPDIVWLTDSLEDGNAADFARALSEIGALRVQTDDALNAALALTPPTAEGSALVFRVVRGKEDGDVKGTLRATGTQGRFLAAQDFTLKAGDTSAVVKFDLATELRNDLARVEIADRQSAGSVVLIDERWRRRPVGLVSGQTVDTAQPLLSDLFYLNRALSPYAELHNGKIGNLVRSGLSVLILADVGQIVGEDKTAVS